MTKINTYKLKIKNNRNLQIELDKHMRMDKQ